MLTTQNTRATVTYELLLSFAGLILIVLLTAYPPTASADIAWRKLLIGSIFSVFCVLGVMAVFSPNKCKKLFDTKKQDGGSSLETPVTHENRVVFQGHHPNCGKYSAHVFSIQNKTYCAACVGLLLGGILALAGSVLYFFVDLNVTEYNLLLVLLGTAGITLGLFQFAFNSLGRFLANIVFVVGALFILIAVDATVSSVFFDFFAVCLTVLWLFTRISLSQWDHERICFGCENQNCAARP
jgi:hypothetical protein